MVEGVPDLLGDDFARVLWFPPGGLIAELAVVTDKLNDLALTGDVQLVILDEAPKSFLGQPEQGFSLLGLKHLVEHSDDEFLTLGD